METEKNCDGCPSLVRAADASVIDQKNVGADWCGRHLHILGMPTLKPAQNKIVKQAFATKCAEFGQPRPMTVPSVPSVQITLGDRKIKGSSPQEQAAVSTCLECKHFIRPNVVRDAYGLPTGMCRESGRAILPDRCNVEATDCEYATPDSANATKGVEGLRLAPQYAAGVDAEVDPIKLFLRNRKSGVINYVEPSTYVSDLPVSADDAADGIRAWRRLDDPMGSGKCTYIPVFDKLSFPEPLQKKVPVSGDSTHPELYVDHQHLVYKVAAAWIELDETPIVWGPPGTGKTELFRHLAWLMQLPFDRISITAQTDVDDLAGKMRASNGTTYFQYGRVAECWTRHSVLVIDEPNVGPPEVMEFLRAPMDNSKSLSIDQNGGEELERFSYTYPGFAANGAHDARNIGTAPLAAPTIDRAGHLLAKYPPEPVERAIIEDRCAADGYDVTPVLDTIMKISKELRALADPKNGTLQVPWGVRTNIKVARATKVFDILESYRFALANYLEPEARRDFMQVIKEHVGGDEVDDSTDF